MSRRDIGDIGDKSTLDRDEMQCPTCLEYRIVADDRVIDDFSGKRDKLVYASRCSNETCPRGRLEPDEVRSQMPNENLFSRFFRNYGILYTGALVIFIGLVMWFSITTLNLFGPTAPADVSGELVDSQGDPIEGATIQIENEETELEAETDSNGEFDFGEVEPGAEFQFSVIPPPPENSEYLKPDDMRLVTRDADYGFEGEMSNDIASVQSQYSTIQLQEPIEVSGSGVGQSTEFNVEYKHEWNSRYGGEVTISADDSPEQSPSFNLSEEMTEHNLLLSSPVEETEVSVDVPLIEDDRSEEMSGSEVVRFDGTEAPTNVQVNVEGSAPYPDVQVSNTVVCSGDELSQSGGTCSIPPSEYNNEGDSFSVGNRDATVSYTGRFVSDSVTIRGENGEVSIDESQATSTRDDGGWRYEGTVEEELLVQGNNTVTLTIQSLSGVDEQADVQVTYTRETPPPERPVIVVTDEDGNENEYRVNDENLENGVFTGTQTIELGNDYFNEGVNNVRVEAENEGSLIVEFTGKVDVEQDIGSSSGGSSGDNNEDINDS